MEFRCKQSAGVSEGELKASVSVLEPYLTHLQEVAEKRDYSAPEASLCLPGDQEMLAEVKRMLERHSSAALKYIFLIGIGGSNLGAKAVCDALRGHDSALASKSYPKIIFLDTVSSKALEACLRLIQEDIASIDEALVNIVSKSGTTLETIANAEIILAALKRRFANAGDMNLHTVVTTDKGSSLDQWASDNDADTLHIPAQVGGRYSVFSPVGLFPLGLCGFNIEKLLAGATDFLKASFDAAIAANPAFLSAVMQFENYKKGKAISDHFFFAPELESVGKWGRQLMAESLGKEKDNEGNIVNGGITPTVSIGSADLHSMAQLYLAGPKDKFTTFICVDDDKPLSVPQEIALKFIDADIANKTVGKLMAAILGGVKASYTHAGLPFCEINLSEISESELGAFMQFKMLETMLLGRLMNVNAFDQPAVESYKKETRKILSE